MNTIRSLFQNTIVFAIGIWCFGSCALAGDVHRYDAGLDTLPTAQGFTDGSTPGGTSPSVGGGALHQPGNATTGGYQFWYANSTAFTFSSNSYHAAEITLRVLSATDDEIGDLCNPPNSKVHGFQFEVIDSAGYQITVTIGTNEVSLAGNNSATNAAFNAADGFHTYRLEIGHRVATLFIDNVSFAVSEFSDPPHHPDEYANRVTFGDGGGCGTSSAEILGVRFQNLMTALAVQPFGSTDVQISWASLDNYKYQVQWRADLTAGGWIDLNGSIQGNGAVNRVVDTLGDAQRFYRLIVLHD